MFVTEYLKNALKQFLQSLKEMSEYTLKLGTFQELEVKVTVTLQ